MKQLELELQERLLIVEAENAMVVGQYELDVNGRNVELICKGDELTEGMANRLVHQSIHTVLFAHYVKDIPVNTYCYKSALESFISAIESKGCFWEIFPDDKKSWTEIQNWKESESRTFSPSRTLIFKIS